jgi:hypothetical protein
LDDAAKRLQANAPSLLDHVTIHEAHDRYQEARKWLKDAKETIAGIKRQSQEVIATKEALLNRIYLIEYSLSIVETKLEKLPKDNRPILIETGELVSCINS